MRHAEGDDVVQLRQQIDIGVGQRLDAVDGEEGLAVDAAQRHAVLVLLADELAVVLDAAMRAGVVAARRHRQRHAAEHLRLDADAKLGPAPRHQRDGVARQFGGQAHMRRPAPGQRVERRLIVAIHQSADAMRAPCGVVEAGIVVDLDLMAGDGDEFAHRGPLALEHHLA